LDTASALPAASVHPNAANKSMVPIKANRIFINRMSNDCPHASDLRHFKASPDPIGQWVRLSENCRGLAFTVANLAGGPLET
jgi:hypothetical protein